MRSMMFGLVLVVAGCGGSSGGGTGGNGDPAIGAGGGSEQVPPIGAAAVRAWLAGGSYQTWHCEAAARDPRGPSSHGRARVCSNDALSANTGGEYAVDAASVKETYDSSNQIIGHAVARKLTAGSSGGDWYWFEGGLTGTPLGDGVGASACIGCHGAATAPTGHDFVYTQVR